MGDGRKIGLVFVSVNAPYVGSSCAMSTALADSGQACSHVPNKPLPSRTLSAPSPHAPSENPTLNGISEAYWFRLYAEVATNIGCKCSCCLAMAEDAVPFFEDQLHVMEDYDGNPDSVSAV